MNLTPEEIQFFRAQRLAASTEAIAFNHALCGQILAVIPATQQPGPSFPVPLATMSHMELNAWKDLKNCYAQMLPILANWKPDIMAVAPAPPELTDLQRANVLLQNFTNEFHSVLSFNFRTPIGSPNYDQLQAQWNSSMLRTDFTKNKLEVDTITKFIFYMETYKSNSRRGCQTSFLADISPDLLKAIKTTLVRKFQHDLG